MDFLRAARYNLRPRSSDVILRLGPSTRHFSCHRGTSLDSSFGKGKLSLTGELFLFSFYSFLGSRGARLVFGVFDRENVVGKIVAEGNSFVVGEG